MVAPATRPGSADDWSEQDLDALSVVGPADQKSAAALWRAAVPPPYDTLLDAGDDLAA